MRRFKRFQKKKKLVDLKPFQFDENPGQFLLLTRLALEQKKKREVELLSDPFKAHPKWLRAFRMQCRSLMSSKPMDYFILMCILVNSVCLAIANPTWTKQDHPILYFTEQAEIIFSIIFILEMLLKWIGLGWWYNGTGYFGNGWNVLDFLIVVGGLFSGINDNFSSLRILRVLRPLRLSYHLPELGVLVITLIRSVQSLVDVGYVLLFFFMIFGIVGVQLWNGSLRNRCFQSIFNTVTNTSSLIPHPNDIFCGKQSLCPNTYPLCIPQAPNPTGGLVSFDNIFLAFGTIFEGMSLVDWSKTMYWLTETWDYGWLCSVYFVCMIFFVSFFALNLVLVVVSNTFEDEKEKARVRLEEEKLLKQGKDEEKELQVVEIEMTSTNTNDNDDNDSISGSDLTLKLESGISTSNILSDLEDIKETNENNKNNILSDTVDTSPKHKRRDTLKDDSVLHQVMLKGRLEDMMSEDSVIERYESISHIEDNLKKRENSSKDVSKQAKADKIRNTIDYIMHLEKEDNNSYMHENGIVNLLEVINNNLDNAESYFKAIFDHHKRSPPFVKKVYLMIENNIFKRFIVTILILNSVLLAIYHHNMPMNLENCLEIANVICTSIFIIEIILKLIGYGPKGYFQNPWNVFDFVVTFVSALEYLINESISSSPVSAFRAMRLIRIFRVFRNWQSLRILLRTVIKSLRSIGYMTLLFFGFAFICAVLGMQLFAGKYEKLGDTRHRSDFDTLYSAFFTCFQLLSGDDWVNVMRSGVDATSHWSILFFYSLSVMGTYIITNLFIAILLEKFGAQGRGTSDWEEDEIEMLSHSVVKHFDTYNRTDAQLLIANRLKKDRIELLNDYKKQKKIAIQYKLREIEIPACQSMSCYIFSQTNPFRLGVWKLCTSIWFTYFIFTVIIINCITLTLSYPSLDEASEQAKYISYADGFFAFIFLIEIIFKIIAFGGFGHKYAFFADPVNSMDAFVCFVSLCLLVFPAWTWLRPFRSLRPIRIVSHSSQIRVVLHSVLQTLPRILYVLAFIAVFWLAFAITGVTLFGGKFYSCTDMSILTKHDCIGTYDYYYYNHLGDYISEVRDRVWVNAPMHFDNAFAAYLTLFQCATLSGWIDISFMASDATSIDHAPIKDNQPYARLYFLIFVIVCSWFSMNLFVGSFIDNFNRLKMSFDGSAFMTPLQQQKSNTNTLRHKVRLRVFFEAPKQLFRNFCFQLMMHPFFEPIIMTLIILNVAIMSLVYYGMSQEFSNILETLNLCFVVIFTLEVIIKISGVSFRTFWKFNWNKFDFIVVLLSIAGPIVGVGGVAIIARILRVGRVIRIVRRSENLEKMLNTLSLSLFSLFNVAVVLFLALFMFAILGVELFGHVRVSDGTFIGLSKYANFSNFGFAFLTVFRMATGDAWHEIFYGAQIQPPFCSIEAGNCGSSYAYLYFNSFMIIGSMILVNLYIAVIVEHFGKQETVEMQLAFAQLRRWAIKWNARDPEGSHYVSVNDFLLLMEENPIPFGFRTRESEKKIALSRKMMFYREINPPIHMKDTTSVEFARQNTIHSNDGDGFWLKKARKEYEGAILAQVISTRSASNIDLNDVLNKVDLLPEAASDSEWCVDFDSTLRMFANKLAGMDVVPPNTTETFTIAEWYAAERIQVRWMKRRTARILNGGIPTQPYNDKNILEMKQLSKDIASEMNSIADMVENANEIDSKMQEEIVNRLRNQSEKVTKKISSISSSEEKETIQTVIEEKKKIIDPLSTKKVSFIVPPNQGKRTSLLNYAHGQLSDTKSIITTLPPIPTTHRERRRTIAELIIEEEDEDNDDLLSELHERLFQENLDNFAHQTTRMRSKSAFVVNKKTVW